MNAANHLRNLLKLLEKKHFRSCSIATSNLIVMIKSIGGLFSGKKTYKFDFFFIAFYSARVSLENPSNISLTENIFVAFLSKRKHPAKTYLKKK